MKDKFSKSWYFRGFEELNFDDNVEFNDLNEFLDTQITKINNVFEGVEGEVRGEEYGPGTLGKENAKDLYKLIMNFRPSTIVETGVCNGFSTSIILKALEDIGEGKLYSIDLPETPETDPNKFWEGKGGAIVPTDKKPGWLVPEEYRSRWEFIEGNSLYKLPKVMKEIEELDVFIHDSEHSYEMMMFEFSLAWKHLKRNGLIISDDITWNPAFKHFSKGKKLKKYKSGSLGILKKRK